MIKNDITLREVIDMRAEDNTPSCYALILNEDTRLGYITLFPDGWHIEKETTTGTETIAICKEFQKARRKAELALTTDMTITRSCHRLTYKELIEEVNKYNLTSMISVISYLIGRYNYIDQEDWEMIWLLYKEEIIED